jgi:hypothetical protein
MREFKIGQYVLYHRHEAEGRFVVIRLLPQPKGETRYIIRSQADPERTRSRQASFAGSRAGDDRWLSVSRMAIQSNRACRFVSDLCSLKSTDWRWPEYLAVP